MKKYIIVALLSILSTSVMAQEKGVMDKVATTVGNAVDSGKKAVTDAVHVVDTSSNFRKIYTDVKEGIGALASSLKVGAEHVYTVLIKQQIVYAVVWLIVTIITTILLIFMMKYNMKLLKVENVDERQITLAVFGSLITVIALIIVIFHLDTMVGGLVNPEYGAIKDIISIVNP